jgi:hypothetical protein
VGTFVLNRSAPATHQTEKCSGSSFTTCQHHQRRRYPVGGPQQEWGRPHLAVDESVMQDASASECGCQSHYAWPTPASHTCTCMRGVARPRNREKSAGALARPTVPLASRLLGPDEQYNPGIISTTLTRGAPARAPGTRTATNLKIVESCVGGT